MSPKTISYVGERHFHVSHDHFIHGLTTFPSILRIFHKWVMLLDFLKCRPDKDFSVCLFYGVDLVFGKHLLISVLQCENL